MEWHLRDYELLRRTIFSEEKRFFLDGPDLKDIENKFDSEDYVDKLKKKFFKIAKEHYGRGEFLLQQDNAPYYTSKFTKDALTAGIKAT